MTEQEMEDLLWEWSEKFLHEPLIQFIRQKRSSVGRSDLIFTHSLGRFLIVELKKGKLDRKAIPQLLDYFGMMKKEFPDKPVELMIVANSIPEERRIACERENIEWQEISEKKFRDIAAQVGYEFESEKKAALNPLSTGNIQSSPDVPSSDSPRTFRSLSMPSLKAEFGKAELGRLLDAFVSVRKREIDKSLAVKLRRELLDRDPPRIEKGTFIQLAKWCKTENPLYWDGMEIARKISILLFGEIIDRDKLGK